MSDEQKVQEEAAEQVEITAEAPEEALQDAAADDELAAALDEVAGLKDQLIRTQAEMQNVRRRAELDVEKAHKFGLEKFANEMLNVVDNLERGLAAAPDEEATKAIREGMEMTLMGLFDIQLGTAADVLHFSLDADQLVFQTGNFIQGSSQFIIGCGLLRSLFRGFSGCFYLLCSFFLYFLLIRHRGYLKNSL